MMQNNLATSPDFSGGLYLGRFSKEELEVLSWGIVLLGEVEVVKDAVRSLRYQACSEVRRGIVGWSPVDVVKGQLWPYGWLVDMMTVADKALLCGVIDEVYVRRRWCYDLYVVRDVRAEEECLGNLWFSRSVEWVIRRKPVSRPLDDWFTEVRRQLGSFNWERGAADVDLPYRRVDEVMAMLDVATSSVTEDILFWNRVKHKVESVAECFNEWELKAETAVTAWRNGAAMDWRADRFEAIKFMSKTMSSAVVIVMEQLMCDQESALLRVGLHHLLGLKEVFKARLVVINRIVAVMRSDSEDDFLVEHWWREYSSGRVQIRNVGGTEEKVDEGATEISSLTVTVAGPVVAAAVGEGRVNVTNNVSIG